MSELSPELQVVEALRSIGMGRYAVAKKNDPDPLVRIARRTIPLAESLAARLDEAEDFRAWIAEQAFTAPDADWNTIRDSLTARLRDLAARVRALEEALEQAMDDLTNAGFGSAADRARAALDHPGKDEG